MNFLLHLKLPTTINDFAITWVVSLFVFLRSNPNFRYMFVSPPKVAPSSLSIFLQVCYTLHTYTRKFLKPRSLREDLLLLVSYLHYHLYTYTSWDCVYSHWGALALATEFENTGMLYCGVSNWLNGTYNTKEIFFLKTTFVIQRHHRFLILTQALGVCYIFLK